MKFPSKCVVDTNVPVVANLAIRRCKGSDVPDGCILNCVRAIKNVIEKRSLVIDEGDEIFDEYRRNLSPGQKPGVGNIFMKWVHDHRHRLHASQRVRIAKKGNSYEEFPTHAELRKFDPDDMKFVAVANAHPGKPPILQASDSEWWRHKDALKKAGIKVNFLCPEYVKGKHQKKQKK